MKSDRRLALFFGLIVAIIYVPALIWFAHYERVHGDLDKYPAYSFPVFGHDSADYARLADNLLTRGVFSLSAEASFDPEIFRTIGYPLFAAGIKWLFGSFTGVVAAQIILAALTAWIIFKIGERVVTRGVGLTAAVLYLLEPGVIFHTITIMSDTLFVFLITLVIYFFIRADYWRLMAAAGLSLGAAILVRPIATFLPLFFLMFYFLNERRRIFSKKVFLTVIVFILAVVIPLAPWIVRNYRITGSPQISSITAYNAFVYNIGGFLSFRTGRPNDEVITGLLKESALTSLAYLRTAAAQRAAMKTVFHYLSADPAGYAKYHLVRTVPFFIGSSIALIRNVTNPKITVEASNLLLSGKLSVLWERFIADPLVALERLFWLAVWIAAIFSWRSFKERRWFFLFWIMIIYFALLTGPVSYSRYRLPAEPFLFLLASAGISGLVRRFIGSRLSEDSKL